jgi:hypothetical protein
MTIEEENESFSNYGGLAYELGRPLLDFVCYKPEQFDDSFSIYASAFDNEFAHVVVKDEEFKADLKKLNTDLQYRELYIYFYKHMLLDYIFTFIEEPGKAYERLAARMPKAADVMPYSLLNYKWSPEPDERKQLFRAVKSVNILLSEHIRLFQKFITHEIEILLHYRENIKVPPGRSIDYIDILDEYKSIHGLENYYIEKPFQTFYGRVATGELQQLYIINRIEDLFRFEFIKMTEHDIFIKKCKNCERFFIPKRRADVEYCERIYGDTKRKCSEIGAMLRYEKKVAENPILESYKRAYRRLHSRTRTKKMTTGDFLKWLGKANKKRNDCLAGKLSLEDFVAWLEQDRIRRSRDKNK